MKQQRPAAARSVGDGLKLHRHAVRSVGHVRTVITLRPGSRARFSTNRFHDTWHVLSDDYGARLLARLLWGLSYQARPGTIVLIDRPFLTPNPFDADPADPIVLVPGWCTPFDDRTARRLKARLPLAKSDGTVRWRTFGLDRTLEPGGVQDWWDRTRHLPQTGRVARSGGLLVLTPGTPEAARAWALDAARLDTRRYGTAHVYLDPWDRGHEGEIQLFRRFRPMVSEASRARAQVLSRARPPSDPEALRTAVWWEAESVRGDAHLRIREWRGSGGYDLGRAAAELLARAEVFCLDDLANIGPVEAYRRMRAAGLEILNLEMLWAMEGALTYRDPRTVSRDRRRELLAELGEERSVAAPIRRRRYRAPVRGSSRPRPVVTTVRDGGVRL